MLGLWRRKKGLASVIRYNWRPCACWTPGRMTWALVSAVPSTSSGTLHRTLSSLDFFKKAQRSDSNGPMASPSSDCMALYLWMLWAADWPVHALVSKNIELRSMIHTMTVCETMITYCICVCLLLSHVWLCNPWTVAHQAPLYMGYPRQEYWNR